MIPLVEFPEIVGAKRTNIDNFLSMFELRCKRLIFQAQSWKIASTARRK
jgi:hypothetical protein